MEVLLLMLAFATFIFCGPIFTAANVLEAMLDCFLPEGWSDGDGTKGC